MSIISDMNYLFFFILTWIKTIYQILFIPLLSISILSLILGLIYKKRKKEYKKIFLIGVISIIVILTLWIGYYMWGNFISLFKATGTAVEYCAPNINGDCYPNQNCCDNFNGKQCCCNGEACYVHCDDIICMWGSMYTEDPNYNPCPCY